VGKSEGLRAIHPPPQWHGRETGSEGRSAVNIVQLKKPPGPMPDDFPAVLRALADQVEAGQCTAFVSIAVVNGEYEMLFPSSLTDSLLLAALLQHRAASKFEM
jgi:hypothetical protein